MLGETHAASASRVLHGTWEAEVGSLPASFCSTADHPSVPTCAAPAGARSGGQGWPVFGPPPSAARSVLDGREHDGSIVRRRGPRSATRTDPAIRKLARRVIKKRAHAQPRAVERPQESDAAARGRSLWTHLGKPGRGGKICQLRFLKRQLVLPVSMMSQWWVRRSSMAVVILASPKTWGQSAKARLVVISSEVFS
jgi:hypothetical protein